MKETQSKENIPQYLTGHIYIATCLTTNKSYVGKTKSHRWNHNKWRPFGYTRRWSNHISEAINNVKKNQCTYLNNAIRKYGKSAWEIKLIMECDLDKSNYYENLYIKQYQTLYPFGYNLTSGGDGGSNMSEEQKKRISNTVSEYWKKEGIKEMYSASQTKKNDIDKINKVAKYKDIIKLCKIIVNNYKNLYNTIAFKFYDGKNKPVNITKRSNQIIYGGKWISMENALKRGIEMLYTLDKDIEIILDYQLEEIYDSIMQDTSNAGTSLEL